MRTVLWTGSRGWEDVDSIRFAIEGLPRPFRSIVGDADGFDAIVWELLAEFHLPRWQFKAQWKRYGRRAGPIRNGLMLMWLQVIDSSGFVIAGWDGQSTGTKNCMDQAMKSGLDVWRLNYDQIGVR